MVDNVIKLFHREHTYIILKYSSIQIRIQITRTSQHSSWLKTLNVCVISFRYLTLLHGVVRESTVCLMGHERRQTLALIEALACRELCARTPMLLQPAMAPPPPGYYVCVCAACVACAACAAAYCDCCRPTLCPA